MLCMILGDNFMKC